MPDNSLNVNYFHASVVVSRLGGETIDYFLVRDPDRRYVEDSGFTYQEIFEIGIAKVRDMVAYDNEEKGGE